MSDLPKITDAEWEVMKVLWEKENMTSNEIVEELKEVKGWSKTTIYTLISRLEKKGAIKVEKKYSPHICSTLINRDEVRKEEGRTFLQKVYDGSLNLLLTNMVETQDLSEKEVDELKKILDSYKKKS